MELSVCVIATLVPRFLVHVNTGVIKFKPEITQTEKCQLITS